MNINKEKFSIAIKIIRESLDYTQVEFGDLLGTSLNSISNWENAKTKPKTKLIEEIIDKLHINPEWLEGKYLGGVSIDTYQYGLKAKEVRSILDKQIRDKKQNTVYQPKRYIETGLTVERVEPELRIWGKTGVGNRFYYNMQEVDPEASQSYETIKQIRVFQTKYLDAFKVSGNSMEPGILDGAYIGVNFEDKHLKTGTMFVFNYPHEGLVVKAVQCKADRVKIYSYNDRYDPEEYPHEEIDENIIIGRVMWIHQETND